MRALARWGLTPLLAAPVGAWALGLGDIELQSALNQPFSAEIGLVSASPEELEGLKVTLAAPETFARYGLDRPAFLSALEFRVVTDRNGRGTIRVTSRQSIAEPFVTLLVEATWPRGRLLREYTVLLDPPVLLPAPSSPSAIRPAETRTPSAAPGGPISRPAPAAPAPAPSTRPAPVEVTPPPVSRDESPTPPPPATPRAPAATPVSGTYGPVRRAETLWGIASRNRPEGVTINQMMVAVFEANPEAFGGNINLLREGATLRLPAGADFDSLTARAATDEVIRQDDAWKNRQATNRELRLLPPAETEVASNPAPAPGLTPSPTQPAVSPAVSAGAASAATANAVDESRRLLELRDQQLANLQEQSAAATDDASAAPAATEGEAGVNLENEQIFAEEAPAEAETEPAPAPAPANVAPARAPAPASAASEPSLVSRVLSAVASPFLWIGLGVAALLVTGLWFVRRRRTEAEPHDVTGRWEALEAEVQGDVHETTEKIRKHPPEDTIVVEEQQPERAPRQREAPKRQAAARSQAPAPVASDETLSSQTIINLDQADAVAEADFHMAYGLYDQAAELVQKALEAAPNRRDLKLKLLEVYFVWGNKEAFKKAAQNLRAEIGDGVDADWDKVVIMGRQICPDESLFTDAKTRGASVDVDLEAGDSPLDLAFDEADVAGEDVAGALDAGLDFNFEDSDELPAPPKPAPKARDLSLSDSSLDIGERTAAGLEAALFAPDTGGEADVGDETAPGLAVTNESALSDWNLSENGTMQLAELPTVETPTIQSPAADAPTVETPTIETAARHDSPTIERPALGGQGDYTAEIDLDDLGLDVKDIDGLPSDLGELPATDRESDTREQPALKAADEELLSATGVTHVLHGSEDEDEDEDNDNEATMLSPGFSENTLSGTEVLDDRYEDDDTGTTSLIKTLGSKEEGLDLDLADLTQALHGAETVEQPRGSSFSHDVFGGGDTPLDLDVGDELTVSDDDPTGTEDVSPMDPQTMTEVGTKLDLARAYIDMGDPEGARSILEEVLDEGDAGQRREAQGLIDVLSA